MAPYTTTVNITTELLNGLEDVIGMTELNTKQDFLDVFKLDRAIIYLLVNWSGPERISRHYVYKALRELDKNEIPLFRINCSDQTTDSIPDWLASQRENRKDFCFGGWGETLLMAKGNIVDLIVNPGQLGEGQTKAKLLAWGYTSGVNGDMVL